MGNFEAECIQRYFLAPGSTGPIGSVYVADDDLLDIFSTDNLAVARQAMLKSLPHASVLRAWFSGEFQPRAGRKPEYVRILMFLCWMQTTTTRIGGERDFRELLEKQLNDRFQDMNGLNPMWEHLRDFLAQEHGIDLVLPGIHPHRQIGRTLRIAFPTWRDRDTMRKVKNAISDDYLLDPLTVSNRIHTSRHLFSDAMQSLDYNFRKFDLAMKRGGREYMETPFWQAWYSIVAEQAAMEEIVVAEGDFGEHELFRVSPLGERIAIMSPEDALALVPKALGKLIRNGIVFLENVGFGKYRAITSPSNTLLMKRSKLAECCSEAIRSVAGLNAGWVVANFRNRIEGGVLTERTPREFGWRDGIRVGGAYLGARRWPRPSLVPCRQQSRSKRAARRLKWCRTARDCHFPTEFIRVPSPPAACGKPARYFLSLAQTRSATSAVWLSISQRRYRRTSSTTTLCHPLPPASRNGTVCALLHAMPW
ncbi:hypothetical protein HED51_12710 [Ochrobactrum grignonense]|nr:hypothetical protein [Brucella grignonensis]